MLIDSHAHLSMPAYDGDRDDVLVRCRAEGVARIVEIGSAEGFASSRKARLLAESCDFVYFTLGLHPHDARLFDETEWAKLAEVAAAHPKAVGIGETGFDFHYHNSSPREQSYALVRSIGLARELKLPLVIHDREAHREVFEVLEGERAFETRGVFHCFSGDWELARRVIDRGWMIAVGGVVTFPKAEGLHEVARRVPLDYLLLETDSPFLTPVPRRGRRNEPWMTRHVAARIAELKGVDPADVIEATGKNAVSLFGLGLGLGPNH